MKIKLPMMGGPSTAVLDFGTGYRLLLARGCLFSRMSGKDYNRNEGCHSIAAVQRRK